MKEDTMGFAGLLVGIVVVFCSVGGFVAFSEQVSYAEYTGTIPEGDLPDSADPVPFGDLSAGERVTVEHLVDRDANRIRNPLAAPPAYVRRKGTVHHFSSYTTFEWTDPGTFGPALAGLAGVGLSVVAVRRSVRH